MNYYQKKIAKLEAEKNRLQNEIITLVTEPDSQKAGQIKLLTRIMVDYERAMWYGHAVIIGNHG